MGCVGALDNGMKGDLPPMDILAHWQSSKYGF